MESLLLYDVQDFYANINELTVTFIAKHLNHIKELALVARWPKLSNYYRTIDQIINSFRHLESLALSVEYGMDELLQHIGTYCGRIKHLELQHICRFDEMMVAIRSFERIESLYLWPEGFDDANLMQLIQHLPNLRHLYLCIQTTQITQKDLIYSNILPVLREFPSIERITIVLEGQPYKNPTFFINARLFNKFIETTTSAGNPNVQIEIVENGKIIGSITGNGIVWRDKLMHWMDCNKNHSPTNVQLLDLAKQPSKESDGANKNCLDRIFDYLDVYSLCSIGETDKRSKQLVESYIQKHSQQHRAFTITDEFVSDDDFHFKNIHFQWNIFARYVTNLQVYPIYTMYHIVKLMHGYKLLDKVTIHNDYPINRWDFTLQQVRHFIFDTPNFIDYSKLYDLFQRMPNVEIIELKRATLFSDFKSYHCNHPNCKKLKKFIFNYRSATQVKNLEEIFENTNTQLIPIL